MNRNAIYALLASIALCLAGCGDDDGGEGEGSGETTSAGGDHGLPGDPAAGETVYAGSCVACHGADGRGNGGLTGADFVGDETRLAKSNDELLTSIRDGVTTGSTPMPAQRDILTDEQMRDALSYIRQEFGGGAQ